MCKTAKHMGGDDDAPFMKDLSVFYKDTQMLYDFTSAIMIRSPMIFAIAGAFAGGTHVFGSSHRHGHGRC